MSKYIPGHNCIFVAHFILKVWWGLSNLKYVIQFYLWNASYHDKGIPDHTSTPFYMQRCDNLTMCQLYHEILPDYCISQPVCDKNTKGLFFINIFLSLL